MTIFFNFTLLVTAFVLNFAGMVKTAQDRNYLLCGVLYVLMAGIIVSIFAGGGA